MSLAVAYDFSSPMMVTSELLGELPVDPDQVIHFPTGLFGFPEVRDFLLLEAEREGVYWLQSVDCDELLFLLVDPFPVFPSYSIELSDIEARELQAESASDVAILAIVTLPSSGGELPTANLKGPLALNLRTRRGKQLAISETEFGVRCPFALPGSAQA